LSRYVRAERALSFELAWERRKPARRRFFSARPAVDVAVAELDLDLPPGVGAGEAGLRRGDPVVGHLGEPPSLGPTSPAGSVGLDRRHGLSGAPRVYPKREVREVVQLPANGSRISARSSCPVEL